MNGTWLNALLSGPTAHLVVAPILLPLLSAALMLLAGDKRRRLQAAINLLACVLGLVVAIVLVRWAHGGGVVSSFSAYLPGNWATPFGIELAVDRLSSAMLLLTSILALAALLFAVAGWDRAGVQFHPLFQLQLLGLNGAFLTADLFNLFVFFEIMLTASYGLLLHGTGWPRVRAGLHYITMNLVASSLFLLGIAVLYGVTGTLNLADMALKISLIPASDRGLLHAGAALLAVAFLAKAALWPLNFWLTPAYSAASPPVAALFAIMTKVGVYALLRLWTLLFPPTAIGSALFGGEVLTWGGLATLAAASVGVLASQHLGRLAGFSVIVSSGTVLAVIGFSQPNLTGGALFYLFSSTLALCALFLVTDLVERSRETEEAVPLFDTDEERPPFPTEFRPLGPDTNLDEQEQALIGRAIPGSTALIGLSFIGCALLVAGLPPLSSFIGKVAMLTAVINPTGLGGLASAAPVRPAGWVLLALLIVSGLLATIAFSRAGIRYFWAPNHRAPPRLRVAEALPIGVLLALCTLMAVRAEPVLRYAERTAEALHAPQDYINAVMSAPVVPYPSRLQAPEVGAAEGRP